MELTITARHCTVPDSVREHTSRLFRRLERYEARAVSATVNFEADHGAKNVEARLAVPGGPPILAHADGPTFRSALQRAVDRLEHQLKRRRQRRRRHRAGAARSMLGAGEPSTL